MRRTPTKDPPEPPAPCPDCGDKPPDVESVNVEHYENGGKTADIICQNCGYTIEANRLVQMPELPAEPEM